jgi:cytochrome c biogenesis protein CcdA
VKPIQRKRSESGQILFLFAASFTTVMLLVMLVVDFGGAALTYERAQVAVSAAAYAAAQGIDLKKFRETNQVALDPGLAASLAREYAAANSRGRLTSLFVSVQDDRVWVVGEMEYRTLFAHAIGIPVIRSRIVASARPAYGINRSGQ